MKSISKKIVVGTLAASLIFGGGLIVMPHNQSFAAVTGTSTANTTITTTDDQETADDAGPIADDQNKEAADLSQVDLQKQAKITKEQSTTIATAQVHGTVKDVQLEDENGTAVYNVQIQDSNGKITEVKVDAATGKITKQEQADNEQEDQD
ncbi:Peptidase propeptide and YPEB domain-containing protein [Paenibacillus sp. GP183]|nr:Peptidase propeptide and YPEB domain-containing protein [Paenibacillus sp. GP183]